MSEPTLSRRAFMGAAAGMAVATALPAVAATTAPPAIPYNELVFGTPCPTIRMLRCRWEDRYRLANMLLGRVCRPGSNVIECAAPQEHPEKPGLYVSSLEIQPAGTRSVVMPNGDLHAEFSHALITVRYSRPEFIPGDWSGRI